MSNIETLRLHLFETLSGLRAGTVDIEKAKAIGDISQVIINSAKVEIDFIKATGGNLVQGGLLNSEITENQKSKRTLQNGAIVEIDGNRTTHRIK